MKATTKIIENVDIKDISLLDKNARYMSQEVFMQLVENIRKDGYLSSTPFCIELTEGKYQVISGNHRVQASKVAGLTKIAIMVGVNFSEDQKRALQLSHNSIVGDDDTLMLKEILNMIQDVDYKKYASIDETIFTEFDKFDYDIVQPQNEIVNMNFTFFDSDYKDFVQLMKEIEENGNTENTVLIPKEQMDDFNNVISEISKKFHTKAYGVNVIQMMRLAKKQLDNE